MDRSSREARYYSSTPLPTLREGFPIENNRDLLFALYAQSCSAWKMLVDVRFKLLGLVPAISIAVITAVLTSKSGEAFAIPCRLVIALLGLTSTLALFIYDRRNSELHDDLISRARKIEDELGIDTGVFRGRLKASCILKHDVATNIVYCASILAWIVAIGLVAAKF